MVHFLGPTGPVASIFVRVTQRYNLARLGEQAFELKGDYPSLLYEGRWYRSGELFECAQRIGGGLAEMGVSPGERVVVTMANCPEVGVVYRALATLPYSHSYGLLTTIVNLHAPEPGVAVLLRWFDPQAFLELIEEHRLHLSAVVPTMLQLLLSQPLEKYDLSSLQFVTSGGAPLAREVAEEFTRRVPSVSVRQGYGLTETAALVATNPAGRVKPGSVGVPVPGTELLVIDAGGREVGPGEVGEICCRSPAVMRGYWRAPEATEQALHDGWLSTGDIGYLDEEGYLFIVDRKKDLIIRGGFNVYPRDVEDALLEHPAVEVAGVVGRPDEVHGEEVVAFVSLRGDAAVTPDELVAWARLHIGGYKYPRELHIVDSVPLTSVGKVDRKALRTQLQLLGA